MIQNPILPGFNPDPVICRRDGYYYLMVSSFEWFPGLPVYRSRDLKNWELYTHVLTDDTNPDLKKLPSSKGIWAPCLTWCEEDSLFYVVYGVMNSMNARYFDVDNFLMTAPDITGPWSEPVYLHSAGFDASILHDDDGKKYIVSLDWETRDGYEKPGPITMVEYDPESRSIKGYPEVIWRGGTERGCIEAPHLYKKDSRYYIMTAEGGTGYYHSVTIGRSENPWGPYEGDPQNPVITSQPLVSDERSDVDHLKPRYYNPESLLQKSGHGSLVETSAGDPYVFHLTSRPFVPELRCTLGRETALQKMVWTDDGWLRMADGSNLAKSLVEAPALPESPVAPLPELDDFDSEELGLQYYSPRIMPSGFTDLKARPGWIRLRGQESQASVNKVSLLACKLSSTNLEITTKMDFSPEIHHHYAGLTLYYDNMNNILLRKYYSETLGGSALSLVRIENGEKVEVEGTRVAVEDKPVFLRLEVKDRSTRFFWSYNKESWKAIGPVFDTSEFSDEYCEFGEFTGTMAGIICCDLIRRQHPAYFDFFEYRDL